MAEVRSPTLAAPIAIPSLASFVERYNLASKHVVEALRDKSVPRAFLSTLEPLVTITFRDAIESIDLFTRSASPKDALEAMRLKRGLESDYRIVMDSLAHRVTSIAIPTLRPSAAGAGTVKALATAGDASQSTLSLPTERIAYHTLRAIKFDGSPVTIAELPTHADITSYQPHSCGANALEAIVFLHSNPERNLFNSEDIEEILSGGVTQYEVMRREIDKKKSSKDPTERMIASSMAGPDGISADALCSFYTHKGLEMEGMPVIKAIEASNAPREFEAILDRLNPGQGALINIFGRDISVTCKLDAEGNKTYAVFDSHNSFPDAEGHRGSSMLSRFSSKEETIALISSRLPVSKPTSMEYSIFTFKPSTHAAYAAAVDRNMDAYHTMRSTHPLELRAILTAMDAVINTVRKTRAEEAEATRLAVARYTASKESEAPAKKEEKVTEALKYRSNITSAAMRVAIIHSIIPTTNIKSSAALMAIFESLSKTRAGKEFLTRLFDGSLTDKDCTEHRELIEFLETIRAQILIPQALLRKKEIVHVAIVVADIVGFNRKKITSES